MWWAGKRAVDVYLGEREIAIGLAHDDSQGATDSLLELRETQGLEEALRQLVDSCRTLPRRVDVRVWLSAGLCQPFLMETVGDLRSDDEQRLAAMVLARQKTNIADPVEIWLEPPRTKGMHRVVVAARSGWVEGALAACRHAGRHVHSIRPWWASVLNASSGPGTAWSALGVMDTDALVVLAGSAHDFDVMETLGAATGPEQARANLARTLFEFEGAPAATRLLRLDWSTRAEAALPCPFGEWVRCVA